MSDYAVFGGEGGLQVFTDELQTEAARFSAALGQMLACSPGTFFPVPASYGLIPTHPQLAQAAAEVAMKGKLALAAFNGAKEKVGALATQLVSCASNYQAAEERAKARPGGAGVAAWPPGSGTGILPHDFPTGIVGLISPGAGALAAKIQVETALASAARILADGIKRGNPPGLQVSAEAVRSLAEGVNGWSLGLPGHHGLGAVGGLTASVDSAIAAGPIATSAPQHVADAPAADSLAGMVSLQGRAWDGQGQLLYTKVVNAQGQETWVVTIPGTQNAAGGVWGNARIAEAMSGKTENVSAAVITGLASVGAKPGARIVLSGHSQGGRHAINLASDKALSSRFTVAGVVTAGAPSGTHQTPRGVKVIQLEDPDDPVPGLDGEASVPTNKERVLVRSIPGASKHVMPGEDAGVLGWEHKVANYKDLAAKADADAGESLAKAIGALGIKGAHSTTYQVATSPASAAAQPHKEPTKASAKDQNKVFYSGR